MNTKSNYQKGFTQINRILNKTAKQYNLENIVYKHKTLSQWQIIAGEFVEEAGSQTKAVDFKKGVLTVACLTREVAYKIKIMAERIILALNQLLGKQLIYAIYLEV